MTENMMTEGTGNVFEDLGFSAAERLVLRADLTLLAKFPTCLRGGDG
jgi:hypothetical protein